MSDPASVILKLDSFAVELDQLSRDLADVERKLEPAESEYEAYLDSFYVGLYEKEDKLPGEDMRLRLARHSMPAELLGRYTALLHSRKRLERRIAALGKQISAQQSILSALRSELESVG